MERELLREDVKRAETAEAVARREAAALRATLARRPAPRSKTVKLPALPTLSRMRKADLVAECERRGLDAQGTVAVLRNRVKAARAGP